MGVTLENLEALVSEVILSKALTIMEAVVDISVVVRGRQAMTLLDPVPEDHRLFRVSMDVMQF